MSLETMDIELYIGEQPWDSPGGSYAEDLLNSLSVDLNPVNFGLPVDDEFHAGHDLQSLEDSPISVPGLDTVVQPEQNVTFNPFSPEWAVPSDTTIGSAGYVSLPSPSRPAIFPENASQPSPQGFIPPLPRQSRNIPQDVRNHGLQDDLPCFLQSPSQYTYGITQGNVFEAATNPEYEHAPEQALWQTGHSWDYANPSQLDSSSSIHHDHSESQDNVIKSAFVPQTYSKVTADAEMQPLEPTETNNTNSGIDDYFSPQQMETHNLANDAQRTLSDTRVLESYDLEGFVYSKVWVHEPAVCPHCDKTFADKTYRDEHIKRSHKDKSERTVQCPHCNLLLMNETNLIRHIKSSHKQGKIVEVCGICNATFSSSSSAAAHRRNVHGIQAATSQRRNEKNIFFKCHSCRSYAKEKGNMKRHVDTVHVKSRRFPCKCGLKFKTKHNLHCHKISKNCTRVKR